MFKFRGTEWMLMWEEVLIDVNALGTSSSRNNFVSRRYRHANEKGGFFFFCFLFSFPLSADKILFCQPKYPWKLCGFVQTYFLSYRLKYVMLNKKGERGFSTLKDVSRTDVILFLGIKISKEFFFLIYNTSPFKQ